MMFPDRKNALDIKLDGCIMSKIFHQVKSLDAFHCSNIPNFGNTFFINTDKLVWIGYTDNHYYWVFFMVNQFHDVLRFLWLSLLVDLCWGTLFKFWVIFWPDSLKKQRFLMLKLKKWLSFLNSAQIRIFITDVRIPNKNFMIKSSWK